MIDTKKYIKDKGLADTLLTGSRTKPIYLEELLNDFAQELVKKLTIPDVVGQSEQLCQSPSHHAMEIGLQDECIECGEKE